MEAQRFPAHLSVLGAIRQMVILAANEAGLPESAMYRLSLAVDEIATNIILYGYQGQAAGEIIVSVNQADGLLSVVLKDTGLEYDPFSREMPTAQDLEKSLEDRDIGGLGIFLAIQGVDHFSYERIDHTNYHRFEMNLEG